MNLSEKIYLQRCFQLAKLGAGRVSPNPMVGSVLVHEERIIGEGWHQMHGQRHAEINAFEKVADRDRKFISESTLFVSLEPCCIFGRTPPCTNRIIAEGIKRVVIGTRDGTASVDGRGVQILRDHGIDVIENVIPKTEIRTAEIRNTYVRQGRPYILLKYAISKNGKIGTDQRIQLSNDLSKRLVHRWRAQCDAIMVGTQTALTDNPALTVRYGSGSSPLRVVPDRRGRLPQNLRLFDGTADTLVFTEQPQTARPGVYFANMDFSRDRIPQMLSELHRRGVTSLMVEGGARLLSSFYHSGLWDRALVFQTPVFLPSGTDAPLTQSAPTEIRSLLDNTLSIYENTR